MLVKIDRREEAISFLEKAFEIFDTLKYNENLEKADLASQISVVLFDFRNHRDAMNFAEKAITIYNTKNDATLIEKILDNHLVIAKCLIKLGEQEDATKKSESIFTMVSANSVWATSLGKYVAESLKTIYEIEVNKLPYDQRCKIYYVCDMMHSSFKNEKPIRDPFVMDKLKTRCEQDRGLTQFVQSIIESIISKPDLYDLPQIVNTSYDEFIEKNGEKVIFAMEKLKILYLSLGSDFLLYTLKPIII